MADIPQEPAPIPPQPIDPNPGNSPVAGAGSAYSGLAQSLTETPVVPVPPVGGSPVPEVSNVPPPHAGGKTSVMLGALFLLIVLPVVGFYVYQKTNVTRTESQACEGLDCKDYPLEKDRDRVCPAPPTCITGQILSCSDIPYKGGIFKDSQLCKQCTCVTPSGTPTPTISPTPTITRTPTPTTPPPTNPPSSPGRCDASCDNDSGCQSGLVCASVEGVRRCRNAQCTTQFSCVCPVGPTATPLPNASPVPVPKTPVSGVPSVLGTAAIAGGALLLIIGLAL